MRYDERKIVGGQKNNSTAKYILPWNEDFKTCGFVFSHVNFSLTPQCIYFDQLAQTFYNAILQIFTNAVEGDIAEFGTFSGASAITISGTMRRVELRCFGETRVDTTNNIPLRKLHLFDSFSGLPQTTNPIDSATPLVKNGTWEPGSMVGIQPNELIANLRHFIAEDRIHIYPGWFKDTVAKIAPETKFAFVHIDGDLYESAYDVLDYFFAHNMFADGCQLLFDDWFCNKSSPNLGEQKAWAEMVQKYAPKFTPLGPYGSMCFRYILDI